MEPVARAALPGAHARLYIDDYYFDAPDTSLSWAVVVGLVAAALASRKRIAWWLLTIYLTLFAVLNASPRWRTRTSRRRRVRRAARGRRDPDRGPQGVLHAGPPRRRVEGIGRPRVRPGVGTLLGWGLVELFPGTLPSGQRFLWALNRVTALVVVENEQFDGHPHVFVNTCWDCSGRSPCSRR
ncbi:hypothetical protein GS934_08605 [Rhodococcus hoagii]|nr:hypothetical protein [Prescottella equi]NKZ87538.1 hypothetical protein [Prescottella equi]